MRVVASFSQAIVTIVRVDGTNDDDSVYGHLEQQAFKGMLVQVGFLNEPLAEKSATRDRLCMGEEASFSRRLAPQTQENNLELLSVQHIPTLYNFDLYKGVDHSAAFLLIFIPPGSASLPHCHRQVAPFAHNICKTVLYETISDHISWQNC